MFSLFAASAHLGTLASNELSAAMTRALGVKQDHWTDLWKLILICNLCSLAPLLFLPLLLTTPATSPTLLAARDAHDTDAHATPSAQLQLQDLHVGAASEAAKQQQPPPAPH